MSETLGGAAIDFTAVPDLNHFDSAARIIDGVDNSELTLSDTIALFCSSKLFAPSWSGFGGKRTNSVDDALAILLLTNSLDLFCRGRLDQQPISGHVALEHGQKTRKKRFAQLAACDQAPS